MLRGSLVGLTLAALLSVTLLPAAPAIAWGRQPEGPPLVEALRAGGHVIVFRHAATDGSQVDRDRLDLASCQTQRNLSEEGRAQARTIGEAFAAHRIPVRRVLASPYCRTLETAILAFDEAETAADLIGPLSTEDEAARRQHGDALRARLATAPAPGANDVLVTHLLNIQAATGLSVAEGEAAIFEPDGAGGSSLVARVLPGDWSAALAAPGASTLEALSSRVRRADRR